MDYMIRATAADEQIRAFAITTKDMVETARSYHGTSPVATAALGRLLTGGVMMGTMMKGEKDQLTLKITGDGPIGGIIVTADSQGHAKGYVYEPEVLIHAKPNGKLDVSGAIGNGMLQVIRDFGLKEPYVGSTRLISGEIAEDLTYYFVSSEQVPSAVGLGVLMEKNNTVKQAGGFIIQLMPFAADELVDKLEKKLADVKSVTTMLDAGMTPEMILEELLGEFGVEITEKKEVSYMCDCSRERVERALISLGKKELQEMIDDGQPVDVDCQFCDKKYHFSKEDLEEMVKNATRD